MLDGMLDENVNVGWAVLFTFARSHPTLSSNILKTIHSSKIQNGGHTCTSNHFERATEFWILMMKNSTEGKQDGGWKGEMIGDILTIL